MTLAPAASLLPGAGDWRTTLPFRFVVDLTCLTEPTRQCLGATSLRALASVLPVTFGTTHRGGTSGGPPPTRPHQVPQLPESSPRPDGERAYSCTVQSEMSSECPACEGGGEAPAERPLRRFQSLPQVGPPGFEPGTNGL